MREAVVDGEKLEREVDEKGRNGGERGCVNAEIPKKILAHR
jgi:hypothetical protein